MIVIFAFELRRVCLAVGSYPRCDQQFLGLWLAWLANVRASAKYGPDVVIVSFPISLVHSSGHVLQGPYS